ncbi:hypothetical protein GPUN_0828 [Glaciecola punicea ACAM 611]|uniref:Uncharacterized protein n=1 Tax=Glaciecola punicea ACAM 611 TaxID=1121923 RepID=H5T9I6_9ALTE|nr:hypothetical protein [Glaciecola punicea]OFA33225.1 hypothetical protein BAE46_00480 [Glaciecola punicea]GAB54963.1 hypothetical protein GPUN_0828 [Glaciecola punicea ACAM 611]
MTLSTDGWKVARTSLQTRNENNKADAWEIQTLHGFNALYPNDLATGHVLGDVRGALTLSNGLK